MTAGRIREFWEGTPAAARVRLDAAWPLIRRCLAVAAANLTAQRARLTAALSGVAVALFLLTLQISVLDAISAKATELFDDLNFDMVVVPDTYQFLMSFDTLDRIVMNIAKATGDVADTFGLNVDTVHWVQLPDKAQSYNFLIGLDDPGNFVRDPAIRRAWPSLVTPHSVLIDRFSQPSIGPVSVGTDARIAKERVTATGQFELGQFFYAEGAAIVRNTNFPRLAERDPDTVSMALLQLKPGVSLSKAKADLIRAMPDHTIVLTRAELLHDERAYFLTTRPIGVMLRLGMIIACLVAAVIIVQVLSTEIANRMKEYAVLKAMGADLRFVYGIGMAQAAMLGLGGLLPAFLAGSVVLGLIQWRTHLDTGLGPGLIALMLAITLTLSCLAGAVIVRRVQRADPAELF